MFVGALARGDAAILLRFPHKGYREKIWDHAAGAIIVQEAGAVITDASGTWCTAPSSRLQYFTADLKNASMQAELTVPYMILYSALGLVPEKLSACWSARVALPQGFETVGYLTGHESV